ncbi:hypothetical protein [Nioella aestuarii]|uniref:hypothetical protein n=1 Tax=Nioella aestuarii TaxID=1662864 RepID=UPI003D7FB5FF
MRISVKIGIAAAVCLVAPMAQAQSFDCAAVMQAFRATPVPGIAIPDHAPCEDGQLQAFLRNEAAIADAVPVTDVEQLYGTWLGDDVLRYLSGVSVPGTEMLVIEPGETEGSLFITQYWLKPNVPDSDLLPWDDEGYAGWVSRGALIPLADGRFQPGYFGEEAITYSGLRLEQERAYELHVLSELNHFELTVQFRQSGDALVLESERLHPLTRDPAPFVTTYTRVDRQAVDMALLLVVALELSYGRYFDCFAHQLTEAEGPLLDVFQPYGVADAQTWLNQLLSSTMARMELIEQMASDTPPEDGSERMTELMEAFIAFIDSPLNQHFVDRLNGAEDLGCPEVY